MRRWGIKSVLNKRLDSRKQSVKTAFTVVFFALFCLIILNPIRAFAKGDIHTGSEEYRNDFGKDFNVGIYIGATDGDTFKDYKVEIEYNPLYVHFLNGDTEEDTGKIVLEGTSPDGNAIREMLNFRPVMGGVTHLKVASATLHSATDTDLEVEEHLEDALIVINAPRCEAPASVTINGKALEIKPETTQYTISIDYTDKLDVTAPNEFVVIPESEELKEGFNQVKVLFGKTATVPLEYTFNINVEKKPEPVVETPFEEEPEEDDLLTILEKQANKTDTDPEIAALNLKAAKMQTLDNEEELKGERKKSIFIVIAFAVMIVLVLVGKIIYDVISNSKIAILRENKFKGKKFFKRKKKSGKLTFDAIEPKRTISEQYFVDGLDIKINDIVDKGKNNAGKK